MAEMSSSRRPWGWLSTGASILSILSCYGTLGVVTALSAMGVTLNLNVHVWALVILAFALLAVVGLVLSRRTHGSSGPLVVGIVGALTVIFAMYGSGIIQTLLHLPRDAVEIVGFAFLLAGAIWDWQLKKA
jgi:hypothetical protein